MEKRKVKTASPKILQFIVKKPESLLAFLRESTGLSGKEIKRALDRGACRLNGKIERFASTKLKPGDRISFHLPSPLITEELTILYQDDFLTLFNKPADMVSEAPEGHYLVHRLDKGTSGIILMARTLKMKKALEDLFLKREINKTYLALVKGIPSKEEGTIVTNLAKKGTFEGQTLYGSSLVGKKAITHYKVLERGAGMSLLELHPETGRTHQLRVHLAELGFPILGDLLYARNVLFPPKVNRLCLHAYCISFIHPETGEEIEVTAPKPKLFAECLL